MTDNVSELKARIAELEVALIPFASIARILDALPTSLPNNTPLRDVLPGLWPTLGDCRQANKAYGFGRSLG